MGRGRAESQGGVFSFGRERPGGAFIFALACNELFVQLIKRVRNVLEKNQPQDDMLVLCGIHIVAEFVSRQPQLGLKPQRCAVAVVAFPLLLFYPRHCVTVPLLRSDVDATVSLNAQAHYVASLPCGYSHPRVWYKL